MNYLFVCTGNTCRSPMAQCLMAHLSKEPCQSAGLYAFPGESASPGACRAMAAFELDLSGHQARPVSPEMMEWADAVYVMTPAHRADLALRFPAFAHKIHLFDPPIPDPFGGNDAVYLDTARALYRQLSQIASKP